MTRAKLTDHEPPEEAVKKIEALAHSLGTDTFWRALGSLDPSLKRPRGRPRNTGRDWAPLLARMADLLCAGDAKTPGHAARLVAAEKPGHSFESTAKQLGDRFRSQRDALIKAAIERHRKNIKRLFPKRPKGFHLPKRTRYEAIVEAAGLPEASREFAERLYAAVKGKKDGDEFNEALGDFLLSVVGKDYWYDYAEVVVQYHDLNGDRMGHIHGSMLEVIASLAEAYEKLIPLEEQDAG